jgi:nitrile hydratase beta subunit
MNGVHDMGGMQGFGAVEPEQDEPVFHAAWEGRVLALTLTAFGFGRWTVDAWRHALERVPAADYLRISYYERWLAGLTELMVAAGLATRTELASGRSSVGEASSSAGERPTGPIAPARAPAPAPATPRFAAGDRVRARKLNPEGHTRLPRFARGCAGRVTALHGAQAFPDASALGLGRHPQPVYQVRFEARELWGEAADPTSAVYVDLWEDYLELL